MKDRVLIGMVLAALLPTQASAATWLCIPDMASGLSYNTTLRKWGHAKFNVAGERFLVKESSVTDWEYEVREFGKESVIPDAWCPKGPNEYGYMFCDGMYGQFKLNTKNLRYLRTYLAGYVEITPDSDMIKEGENTPFIEIGKCSKI